MKLKAKASFHNRFDIEVIRNGKVINKGQAENIILDRMWTRVCNFESYFSYIHFGRGIDTLDPTRTTLFDRISYKAVVNEETIKAFPVSSVTKKITLMPEDYVDETITEVGVSESTSYINTHALIKDAEGNPLSITKTDIDIIIIYATVFVQLENKNDNVYFTRLPDSNSLINYFVSGGASSTISVGKHWTKGHVEINEPGSKSGSRTADVLNKKIVLGPVRFNVGDGNGAITCIECFSSFVVNLPEASVFTSYALDGMPLGIGDGVGTHFYFRDYNIANLVVKLNGVVTAGYTLEETWNYSEKTDYFTTKILLVAAYIAGYRTLTSTGDYILYYSKGSSSDTIWKLLYLKSTVNGELRNVFTTTDSWSGTLAADTGNYFKKDSSFYQLTPDGVIEIAEEELPANTTWDTFDTVDNARVEKIGGRTRDDVYLYYHHGKLVEIVFDTPPVEGSIITADYTVPYIPKTEDYILDISAEIQFGEGI